MRHLTLEEIARLVDEPPRAGDAAHLDACPACRAELEAMREQTEGLAGLADPEPPPWVLLEARLEAEGLLRRPRRYPALRMAASVAALALGGAAAVAAWRGGGEAPPTLPRAAVEAPAPPAAAPAAVEPAPPRRAVRLAAERAPEPAAPVEEAHPHRAPAAPPAEDAVRELREAEAAYLRGLAEYASLAGASSPSDPVARLAALEGLVRVTRSALDRAPGDPVFNGYYLAAVGERDAMIRQLARTSHETWY